MSIRTVIVWVPPKYSISTIVSAKAVFISRKHCRLLNSIAHFGMLNQFSSE